MLTGFPRTKFVKMHTIKGNKQKRFLAVVWVV